MKESRTGAPIETILRNIETFVSDMKALWRGDHIYQQAAAENTRAKFDKIKSTTNEIRPQMTRIFNENYDNFSRDKLALIWALTQRLVTPYTIYNITKPDVLVELKQIVDRHYGLSDQEYNPDTAVKEIRSKFLEIFGF